MDIKKPPAFWLLSQRIQIILDIILVTIKINSGYYEKLFWHFEFGNNHLLLLGIIIVIICYSYHVIL